MIVFYMLIAYIIGLVGTYVFLTLFGKSKFGIDYEKQYHDDMYPDYPTNGEAFIWWSIGWPFIWVWGFYLVVLKFSNFIQNYRK